MIERYDPSEGDVLQILAPSGEVDEELEPDLEPDELRELYRYVVLTRVADRKALKLQRTGRLGTYAPSQGHEATQVGSAYALSRDDWMFPYFRDLGSHLIRGVPLHKLLLYWKGDERGMDWPDAVNNFTIAVPVASQIPHGVGASMAAKNKDDGVAVMVYLGDGATSEGDFHEGMNFAGVFDTPTVFVCHNNQYAISTPVTKQSASETLAQKACAYGFPGIKVDGMDVLATYAASREAVERARSGEGPTLIEALNYRYGDHTTSDDASRYRNEEELDRWLDRDPIDRFRKYLESRGVLDEEEADELEEEVGEEVDEAASRAEEVGDPGPGHVFDNMYAETTDELDGQLEELKEFLGGS